MTIAALSILGLLPAAVLQASVKTTPAPMAVYAQSHYDPAVRAAEEGSARERITETYKVPEQKRRRSGSAFWKWIVLAVPGGLWLIKRVKKGPAALGAAVFLFALPASAQPVGTGRLPTREHREERFRFSYPPTWQVSRGASMPGVVSLHVTPSGSPLPRMVIMYRRMDPATRVTMLHQVYMEEFVKDDRQIAWSRVGYDAVEELNGGEAMTTTFRRTRFQPMTNIATTVCSAGDTVLMVYEYDHTRGDSKAVRDLIAATLTLGDGSIAGRWYGQGSVLELDPSGRAHLNWSSGGYSNDSRRGTWSLDGQRLRLNWEAGGLRPADTVTCDVSFASGGRLRTRCSDLPGEVVYQRH